MAAHAHLKDFFGRRRQYRREHLIFFVANGVRVGSGRRLHGDERQQIHDMILYHVAKRSGIIVIAAALLDAERFRGGNLYGLNIIARPDRFKDRIGESERHDVLHGLFTEVMIDAVDEIFAEDLLDFGLQRLRRCEVGTERLLDDDAAPALRVLRRDRASRV